MEALGNQVTFLDKAILINPSYRQLGDFARVYLLLFSLPLLSPISRTPHRGAPSGRVTQRVPVSEKIRLPGLVLCFGRDHLVFG